MAYPYPPPQPQLQPQPSTFSTMPVVPTIVVGPQFCAPYPMDLNVVKKVLSITDGNFVVTDTNDNIIFKVKNPIFEIRDRRVLIDTANNPIITLRRKIMTAHDRWLAFRGESTDYKDLLFTVKRSSLLQFKANLDVFLAYNNIEDVCDFKVKGSWLERSCIIYAGDSNNIVAQMHKMHTVQSIMIGKDNFMVTVYPHIDYAFIVALIVILNEINRDDD